MRRFISWNKIDKKTRRQEVKQCWDELDFEGRYVLNKLLTNSLQASVSIEFASTVVAAHYEIDPYVTQHNLNHQKGQFPVAIENILDTSAISGWLRPIEFQHATDVEDINQLTSDDWLVSYEWDGVRVQLVKGEDDFHLWTQRGELITDKVPEINSITDAIPSNSRLDGILVAANDDTFYPKSHVRKRLKRKSITPKIIAETPFVFIAIDLFGINDDVTIDKPFNERLADLDLLFQAMPENAIFQFNENHEFTSVDQLQALLTEGKQYHSRGLILRKPASPYLSDSWVRIKNIPHQINVVLLYVKRGEGAFSNEFKQFTLGIYSGRDLLPIATCENTLEADENTLLKSWVRENRIERFGPVVSVEAQLIMRIEFVSVELSKRRKSGYSLKKPKLISWEKELLLDHVSQLHEVADLLE